MKAEQVTVRRIGIGLAVAAALLASSACAAGQYAQTATENETIDGTKAIVGSMTLGGLAIVSPTASSYPKGADVSVRVVIVNSGQSPDKLTSISSPAITSWGAYATPAQVQAAAQSRAEAAASAAPTSGAAAPSGAAGSSGSPAPNPTEVAIDGHARVSYGTPEATGSLLLIGIKNTLYPGSTIPVTFTFQRAGTVTAQVPVQVSKSPQTSIWPNPAASTREG